MNNYKNSVSNNIPFTQIPNSIINDENLDWNAKGVFCYLASKPDTWVFYETEIAKHSPKGLKATKGAILKLIEAGYLKRYKKQDEIGRFIGWAYELVYRDDKKRTSEKTDIGKTHTSNTNSNSNKDLYITNVIDKVYGKPEINEMFSYWEQVTGLKITSRAQQNRNACNNLIRKHGMEKLKKLADGVALAQKDKYAPRISDFISLQAKTNDLILWGKQQINSNTPKVVKI